MDTHKSVIFLFSIGNVIMFTLNCCREYRNCQFAEFNGGVHFFCFRPEIPFLGKFDPKTRNGQFKLKFGT